MPDITVQRHGDRWAVAEADAESATMEFETREAAESAARAMADGGKIEVREDDPSGLGHDVGEPEPSLTNDASAVSARERARSPQSGL